MMEESYTGKDFYTEHFNPRAHLENYYKVKLEDGGLGQFVTFFLKGAHRAFTIDGIKGDTLIDIGSGATIHQFLSACESFREIIATDYALQNRKEVQRWLKKEPGAFDWTPIVKYVCDLEGDREKWPEKEEKVRRTVKKYLKCDVTQPNPLAPLVLPPADCLLSSLCFDGACRDIPTYRSAFRNISSLLKPGGHLLFYSTLEGHYYTVGQHRFSNIFLEKDMIEEAEKWGSWAQCEKSFKPKTDVFGPRRAHRAFTIDGIKGDTLIDIGSGATIHQFLSACESFREIIATDYALQNREEVQRWLRKEPGAFDWTPIVKYVCDLEGDREKWPEKEEKVRRAVKQYLKCDVTQPNPLAPLVLPPADCLLSTLCFDGACRDIPTYRSAFRNISSLLKPGGHLLFNSSLEGHYYTVGQHRFSVLYLERERQTRPGPLDLLAFQDSCGWNDPSAGRFRKLLPRTVQKSGASDEQQPRCCARAPPPPQTGFGRMAVQARSLFSSFLDDRRPL
ncbi:nicotinamide N-methyltransferase-like [Crotalus adamanteus]|uniref:Nicotinamide N-methyltransferase-like n=1 Tax=Crotalus adamanteus TaxID=8729 RepID=A0AAW1AYY7_CROAD